MVLAALGLGWIAGERRKVWLEDRAVAEIERLGGYVLRRMTKEMIESEYLGRPNYRSWQQRLFGDSYSCPVENVYYRPEIGSEALRPLKGLRAPQSAMLMGACLDDEDIPAILELESLVRLDLSATDVTDAGVQMLLNLPNLQELDLDHTCVSDRSLEALATKPFLEISLRDTDVTAEKAASFEATCQEECDFHYAPAPSGSHREAAKRLLRLGARVYTRFGDEDPSVVETRVVVPTGGSWRGTSEDLQVLADLIGITNVALEICDEEYLAEVMRLDVTPSVDVCVSATSARRGILSASAVQLHLSEMQKLSALQLCLPLIRKETLAFLPHISSLRSVELELSDDADPKLTISCLEPLRACRHLRDLSLSNWSPLPQGALRLLAKCPELERLNLGTAKLSDCDQRSFRKMTRLRSLGAVPLHSEVDLVAIGRLPNLRDADIRGLGLTNAAITAFKDELRERAALRDRENGIGR